jgi:hypothetical protein
MATIIRKYGRVLAWAAALAMGGGRAQALINPSFTPVHLVRDSTVVLELQVGPAKEGKATARIQRVLKGKVGDKTLALSLTASGLDEHRKAAQKLLDSKDGRLACFFVCQTDPAGGAVPADSSAAKGFLHVEGAWLSFQQGENKDWEMVKLDDSMNAIWNGGTDMLIRAVEYVLADPRADLPVKEGISWASSKQFATLEGAVHAAMPVDLAGDGTWALHIACEGGDRLFRYDAKAGGLADITAAVKLSAKSKVSTWGDFNGDGQMDLLSYNGETLVIHTRSAEGTFVAGKESLKGALTDGCLSLTCIDVGKVVPVSKSTTTGPDGFMGVVCVVEGKLVAGVVIGTRAVPLLWLPGRAQAKPIGGAFAGKELGAPGLCLVADFDGDGLPDILQLFEKGSLVYQGEAPGQFHDARPCKVAVGAGQSGGFLGDFDADGLLDVFTVCSDGGSKLWNNRGKFEFVDTSAMTGELTYKGASGAVGGATGDFNNDGRQDVLFLYAAEVPRLYFNRGFRSFGLANGLDVSTSGLLPKAEDGQQAGCLADLNGDGVQDTVVVLKNGQAWVLCPEAAEPPRTLRAALSSKGGCAGPVTATAYRGSRCLGAWNVTAGVSEAFVGLTEAGAVVLKWQPPGSTPREKKLTVTSKPIRVVLDQESP